MRRTLIKLGIAVALAVATSGASSAVTATATSGVGPTFQYIGPLTFGPDGVLFAADAKDVSVSALQLGALAQGSAPGTKSVDGIDGKIAALLGTDAKSIQVTDLAVHPKTRNAFISVVRGHGAQATSALIRVDGTGAIEVLALDKVKYSKVKLPNPPGEITPLLLRGGREIKVANYPEGEPANPMFGVQTITDIAFLDGRLWVAGLSSEEFASKLRSIAYPFSTADEGTSIEIYHGSHGQFETRSPVFTFLPHQIDGKDYIVAAYLCTPLVKIPVSSLRAGEKVVGTTIAELGSRNRPLDMISYKKDGREYILMSNNSRGVMKIPTAGFDEANGITEQIPNTAGVSYEIVASMKGVEQMDRLDDRTSLIVARADTGSLNLQAVALP